MKDQLEFPKPPDWAREYKSITIRMSKGEFKVKIWKPNMFQRFMYWAGFMKDPRYKKSNAYLCDECGQFPNHKPK